MPREPRVVIPGAPHHVYDRGNNRRRLFSYSSDRLRFLRCLCDGLTASRCVLHQITLMTNHVHMIVTPFDDEGLAVLMKSTKQKYAQGRNREKEGSGSLFEARFKSKPITSDKQLMTVTLYNDANAHRAGLLHGGTRHEWSTGPLHAGRLDSRIPRDMWTPSPWYLGLAGAPRARGARYEELMQGYLRSNPEPPHEWATTLEMELRDVEQHRYRIERPDRSSAREHGSSRLVRKD